MVFLRRVQLSILFLVLPFFSQQYWIHKWYYHHHMSKMFLCLEQFEVPKLLHHSVRHLQLICLYHQHWQFKFYHFHGQLEFFHPKCQELMQNGITQERFISRTDIHLDRMKILKAYHLFQLIPKFLVYMLVQ